MKENVYILNGEVVLNGKFEKKDIRIEDGKLWKGQAVTIMIN